MPERIDVAFETEQLFLKSALWTSKKQEPKLPPNGLCHNCQEPLAPSEKLFCDLDCSEDWGKRAKKALYT